MLPVTLVLGLMCAAAAWAITQFAFAQRLRTAWARNVVWALWFAVLFAAGQLWVAPVVQRAYAATLLDDALQQSSPVWRALKAYDPASYSRLLASARLRLAAGDSPATAVAALGGTMRTLAVRRVGNTSDAAALAYLRVLTQELDLLLLRPGDLCWQFLNPGDGDTLDLSAELPRPLLEADQAAFAEVLRLAATAPQALPTTAQFATAMRPAALRLGATFLDDLDQRLRQPQPTLAGRRQACVATSKLYAEIFTLPPVQAGITVRYLMGQAR